MSDTVVVVGLGNPGPRYEATRHNIGFRLLDALASDLGAGAAELGSESTVWRARHRERDIVLVRPQTFMNLSGRALLELDESERAGPDGHLIVFDDVALPFGAIRFRRSGGAGGHRGLASVLACLGTESVPRLRLGVGEGEPGRDLAEYVLEPFTSEEEERIESWLARAVSGVRVFLDEGPEAAMNMYNRAPAVEPEQSAGEEKT